jgi:bacillolysin
MRRGLLMLGIALVLVAWHPLPGNRGVVSGQAGQVQALTVAPTNSNGVRDWDNTITRMLRSDDLRVRLEREDTLIPGRTVQQLDQYSNGVPIWGAGVSRQLGGSTVISVFGLLYQDPAIDVTPRLTQAEARSIVEQVGGTELGPDRQPRLMILPESASFRLVWVGEIVTLGDKLRIFIDASTGAVVRRDSILETQLPSHSYVGHGRGVLSDDKKISTEPIAGGFRAYDTIRPPEISTYDLRSNFTRFMQLLNGVVSLVISDWASAGSNNDWSDASVVDAHVYSSYTYDYYYKQFGRQGLDNHNISIDNVTHVVRRSDAALAPPSLITQYWAQAAYLGDGLMYYGEGLDNAVDLVGVGPQRWNYLSGGLDVVAHELTHGVTEFTSDLIYANESGALNESFSDIMGTSVEFFFQPVGTGPMKADYLLAEDVVTAASSSALSGLRSMADPGLYGDPDHYSKRYIGNADNGGVHTNSGISNQAFYLAIEGGVNRTSSIRVQGVGAANRAQIEKVFYRAFAQLMPRNANFSLARAITLQAATDLYGANSPPYNAVRDAWTAVGVN